MCILWRDLTSGYDMIGPYFPVSSSVDSNILQEFFLLSLKAFSNYGFKVSIVLWDGASSNLTLLKLLCGSPRATLPVNEDADDLRGRYFANMSFVNPEDPSGNPIFAMICLSHQVLFFQINNQHIQIREAPKLSVGFLCNKHWIAAHIITIFYLLILCIWTWEIADILQ